MRDEVTRDARTLLGKIEKGIKLNLPATREDLTLLGSQLALIEDSKLRDEIEQTIRDAGETLAFGRQPPALGEAVLAAEAAEYGRNGIPVDDVDLLSDKRRIHASTVERLKSDPIGLAVERQIVPAPAPLDFSNAGALVAGLAQRQQVAGTVAAHYNRPAVSILMKEEAEDLGRSLDRAPAAEQAVIFGAMADSLDGETYRATLQQLAGKTSSTAVWAGAMFMSAPSIAESVLRGRELLRANPDFGWKTSGDTNRLAVDDVLPPTIVAPSMEQSRQDLIDAVRTRYADLSSAVGDATGTLDTDRLEQAAQEVTGGILEFNGQKLIAPNRQTDQRTFDAIMNNLTDDDVRGAQTTTGIAVTAADVRRKGTLQGAGDGRYFVLIGDGDTGNYVMSPGVTVGVDQSGELNANPGPFILDLNNLRPPALPPLPPAVFTQFLGQLPVERSGADGQ